MHVASFRQIAIEACQIYALEPDGVPRLREAACWAHLRRELHNFWASNKSEIARDALDQIGKLYDIERDINGQAADVRHAARQKLSQLKVKSSFVQTTAFAHSWQERSSQGLPLWPQSAGSLQPVPH